MRKTQGSKCGTQLPFLLITRKSNLDAKQLVTIQVVTINAMKILKPRLIISTDTVAMYLMENPKEDSVNDDAGIRAVERLAVVTSSVFGADRWDIFKGTVRNR